MTRHVLTQAYTLVLGLILSGLSVPLNSVQHPFFLDTQSEKILLQLHDTLSWVHGTLATDFMCVIHTYNYISSKPFVSVSFLSERPAVGFAAVLFSFAPLSLSANVHVLGTCITYIKPQCGGGEGGNSNRLRGECRKFVL